MYPQNKPYPPIPFNKFTQPPKTPFAPSVVPQVPEVYRPEPALIEERREFDPKPAIFFHRFLAFVLDGLILGVIETIVAVAWLGLWAATGYFAGEESGALLLGLGAYFTLVPVLIVVAVTYHLKQETGSNQATFGKRIMGLKVVSLSGGRITGTQAIGRLLSLTLLSGLFFSLGFWMALFTAKNQALHDLIAGTLVVESRSDSC